MEVIGAAPSPGNIRRHYFSAPTSPSHLSQQRAKDHHDSSPAGSCRLSSASVPFDWEETPGTPKSPAGDDFAFQVSRNYENAPLSAEDLFSGGVIKPLKPPPRLQIPPAAPGFESAAAAAAAPRRKSPAKVIHGALFSPAASRRAARSISPIRGRGLLWNEEGGDEEEKRESPATSAVCSAKGQKKWRLKDLFLFRSASEGRAADKDPLKKYTAALRRSSFTEGSESRRRRRRREPAVSAHEVHYTANRAVSEDLKKKTFLPYKQGILGRFAFNPAHGFGFSRK